MLAIVRKELADYFTSIRVAILFILVFLVSAAGIYAANQGIRGVNLPDGFVFLGLFITSGNVIPSLVSLIALLVPIIGLTLGFDAINSERTGGTLSRVLSQPIFRDSVINGKFLAGIITLTIMVTTIILLMAGYGLRMIGVPPTAEEIIRLFIYIVFTVIYGGFWMGLSMLFSVVFRRVSTSLLASIGIWLFFSIFIFLIIPGIANAIAPTTDGSQETLIRNAEMSQMLSRLSPNTLFSEAATALLLPVVVGTLGVITASQAAHMLPNPLSLGQSLILIWPHLTSLVALGSICFAISYITFMRQEIRAS
jgi:ABC-2 type transport system permease protein